MYRRGLAMAYRRRMYGRSRTRVAAGARVIVILMIITIITVMSGLYYHRAHPQIGTVVDSYRGVAVYYNGQNIERSHGQNYSPDGYCYGQKWQCVEFAKRYYYIALQHRMPDAFGNANDFWDERVAAGKLNHRRGLLQYRNGGEIRPQVDDLLVFTNGPYGHVAVICEVGEDSIVVVQQNVQGHTRQSLTLTQRDGHYYIGDSWQPAGWLRLEK